MCYSAGLSRCRLSSQTPNPHEETNATINRCDPVTIFRELNFGGKTAQELAIMSRQRELIRVIEAMQKAENIHLTQCKTPCYCRHNTDARLAAKGDWYVAAFCLALLTLSSGQAIVNGLVFLFYKTLGSSYTVMGVTVVLTVFF
jgi:hypothetical protein